MKTTKILTLIAFAALTFSGCIINNHPDYPPVEACFATDYDTYQVDEIIYFNNCSDNVVSYQWDFDDGTYSTSSFPSHSYSQPGTYQVTLTAYGQEGESITSKYITVEATTDLDILVMYEGTDDPVSNCEVTLYETEQDWIDLTNPFLTGNTDNGGSIIFINVDPVIYYIDAFKYVDETRYYCNENLGYITDSLVSDQINYYNVYVELLTTKTAKLRTDDRKAAVVKRIVKTDGNDPIRKSLKEKNKIFRKK